MNQKTNATTQGVRNAASQGVMNAASQGVNGQGDHVMGPPNQTLPTQHLNDEAGPSTQAIGPELANTQESKKRKPNANGSRQSAPCWEFFIKLPDIEVEIPTAVYNQTHNYVIQAKKACDQDEYMEGTSDTLMNDIFIDDYEVNKCCFDEAYPAMNDTTIMSFMYDTTISNDSPLDFLGGSMTNYSRIGSVETFGSVENLSLDDFYIEVITTYMKGTNMVPKL
ncbi:hypothetical protein P8452_60443 [Trifolium repens]|nr:hypothetical protein P8452_60443 [Trifolium repens]